MVPDDAKAAVLSASVPSRFAALQRHFIQGLPARWSAIALAARGSETQRAELHRLAGAAGSFGYVALGEAARVAECCRDAGINAALSKLQALLQEAIKGNPVN